MTVYENCTALVWILISIFILFVFLRIRFLGAIERCKQGEEEIRRLHNKIKQTEAELQTIRNHLVHTEKMASLGELVAGIAHEINTPIGNSITTISHLEIKACECSEKLSMGKMKKTDLEAFLEHCQQVAKISLTNLERGAELIRSLKKIAVDQSIGEKRQFELHEYMNDVLISLNPQIKRKNHKVILNCPPGIKVWSYPGAIWQIISNLLNNSLLHGYEEDEEGTITIEICHENEVPMTIIEIIQTCDHDEPRSYRKFDLPRTGNEEDWSGTRISLPFQHPRSKKTGPKRRVGTPDPSQV